MTVHQHHKVEAGILLREFEAAGFDCRKLLYHPVFMVALNQYGACRMSWDELCDVAHGLGILDPKLRRQACDDTQASY